MAIEMFSCMLSLSSFGFAGLLGHFDSCVNSTSTSTPSAAVLSSLLQSLQRIPTLIESKSRQILPLFLKFMGYSCEDFRR